MEHLKHLKNELHGKNIKEIEKYFKDEYGCKVKKSLPLFCPMYDMIKTDFRKMGALATRGTVFALNDDGVFDGHIVCVPFFKFFNHGESLAHDGPDEDIVSIQRKYDGSLIKVFNFKNEWHVATNGTAVADENFTALFEKAIGLTRGKFDKIFDREKVYIFELCTPENRIVVCYNDYSVRLLLTRCKHTWEELDNGNHVDGHYQVVEDAIYNPTEVGEEGVVVLYKSGHRVKKKTAWYKKLHKGFKGAGFNGTDLNMIERAIHGGFYDDVLVLCSEEGKKHAAKYKQYLVDYLDVVDRTLKTFKGITGLEKQEDKDNLIWHLKEGTIKSFFPNEAEYKRVLNVLFGKYDSLYYDLEKGGKNAMEYRIQIKDYFENGPGKYWYTIYEEWPPKKTDWVPKDMEWPPKKPHWSTIVGECPPKQPETKTIEERIAELETALEEAEDRISELENIVEELQDKIDDEKDVKLSCDGCGMRFNNIYLYDDDGHTVCYDCRK